METPKLACFLDEVLKDPLLWLEDRVALACMFLPPVQLKVIETNVEHWANNGRNNPPPPPFVQYTPPPQERKNILRETKGHIVVYENVAL